MSDPTDQPRPDNRGNRQTATTLLLAVLDAHEGERISLATLLEPLKRRAFGFLLLLLAIPNFVPVAVGIGGVMGMLVIALGVQMLLGLEQPWLSPWVGRRTISCAALRRFLMRIAPVSDRLEQLSRPRLTALTIRPLTAVSGLVMMLLGLLLALPLPFTNYLFGAMVIMFALALIERDGALLLVVWLATLASVTVSATLGQALAQLVKSYF